MSTNYVPHHASLPLTYSKIVSSDMDEDVMTGRTKPPRFVVERPQSISVVIDGKSRTPGMDPFNFRVSINNNLFRARLARVHKVVMPKPPNINQFNNVINFNVWDGSVTKVASCTLQPAFYTSGSLSNELATKMTAAAFAAGAILSIFTVSFDPITRTFNIGHTYNGAPEGFYIDNTSSFIIRGEFLAPFASFAPGASAELSPSDINSGTAGMLYTRYAIISSESFNQYSFSDSRATTLFLKNNIICIIDMTTVYTSEDFDVAVPFSGTFTTFETPDAPHIMVTNPQKNMNERVDIFVQDEYGEAFHSVMDLGADYPTNTLGVSLWMEVSF